MTRKIKRLKDFDLLKLSTSRGSEGKRHMPLEQYPASCWNEALYLVKHSLDMAKAASNHQQTWPIQLRGIQTAHASGEPLQQQFRVLVVELAEAASDLGSARKHLLRYFTHAFIYQGSVRHIPFKRSRYSVLIEVGRSRGNHAAVSFISAFTFVRRVQTM